jgi:hypothetical protein
MPAADNYVRVIVVHEANRDEATAQFSSGSQSMRSIEYNTALSIDDNWVLETLIRGQFRNESAEKALQNLLVKK